VDRKTGKVSIKTVYAVISLTAEQATPAVDRNTSRSEPNRTDRYPLMTGHLPGTE
jgi:hypothetical protein